MKKINEAYIDRMPKYIQLKDVMIDTLNKLFRDHSIDLFSLDGRVKTVDSFVEKVDRKRYEEPFEEVEDICGLRVICYYSSELDVIESIIESEFSILSSSDKQKESGDDRFGYLSRHYVVCLKEQWLHAPLYRDLSGLKIEIQIRTILMHTWAAISHKLMYKKESDAPAEINRKLNRLSALIELADEQFDSIRVTKSEYIAGIAEMQDYEGLELNPDTLISIVNKYSPDRKYSADNIIKFLDEIDGLGITAKVLDDYLSQYADILIEMEKENSEHSNNGVYPYWSLSGYLRALLDLSNDDYYNWRWYQGGIPVGIPEATRDIREKFRDIAKGRKH